MRINLFNNLLHFAQAFYISLPLARSSSSSLFRDLFLAQWRLEMVFPEPEVLMDAQSRRS